MTDKKILIGTSTIMDYIGIKKPELFKDFIKKGMPARMINNRWYAHTDNLDRYFRSVTNLKNKDVPGDD